MSFSANNALNALIWLIVIVIIIVVIVWALRYLGVFMAAPLGPGYEGIIQQYSNMLRPS